MSASSRRYRYSSYAVTPEFAAFIADFELEALVSLESILGIPENDDAEGEFEFAGDRDAIVEIADSEAWDFGPLLSNLHERDIDMATGVCFFPVAHCMNVISCDDDGRLERSVSATIYEDEDGFVGLPIGRPLDERFFGHMQQCSPAQRVRLLTEFVRIFRELVSGGSLGEGLRGDAISRLRELVGFLRHALRELRTVVSSERDDAARDRGEPSDGYPYPLHGSSPSVASPSVVTPDAANSTVGGVA